ncbi:PaREP1 family protein [Pyrobaculum aerophilum]|uniref:PaREP1 n=1 Tax=Pyrobaculum aerophilum TaxID=13773 RepID=A0A371QVV5_9CREN|nr:PaREP1 family protein [Pyrobaculum aerophilum]RFA94291.1 hypothetical protein CGL51_10450 [Pyrobaculum aerophilum]RFA95000.1 hypothetical protein CGL52_13545 [Pyrobaculum aerophilum]
MNIEMLERPWPKPTTEDYASARLLEALAEARLAVEFLERGLVRNAALLRLELERLKAVAKTEEERKWLETAAVARVPTSRLIPLSQMLGELGYSGITFVTDRALNLHDYQYHGPDPDMALSKYRNREEAALAVLELVAEIAKRIEALRGRVSWSQEMEKILTEVKERLTRRRGA